MASVPTGPRGWALVTGACSGIGLELSRELAARGWPILALSNRCTEIEAVARDIHDEFRVPTQSIHLDLSRPGAARELYEEVGRMGIDVEILVSNAGVFLFGEVADTDPDMASAMLYLHVVNPSLLARYFGQDMRRRRSGYLMFVSSASTWKDFPGIAYYGSSKRYLRSFSTALRTELLPWGVGVTCLAPGAVNTQLYGRESAAAQLAARLGLLKDARSVARAGVRGMLRRRALVLPGVGAKAMALAAALTPRWLIGLVRRRTNFLSRPPAQATEV